MKSRMDPTGPFWVIVCACLLAAACAKHEPAAIVLVEDRAGLLSEGEEASVAGWHAALLAQHDIDYRVLTVAGPTDLAALALRHFEEAEVGRHSQTGRGLLLVIDASSERVRLEVARELEGVFVDSFVAYVEREQLAPFFAAGRVGDGIVAASELIAGRAEEAIEQGVLDDRATLAGTAGAGAESRAGVDDGYRRPTARAEADGAAQSSPLETVAAYLGAMAVHDASPDLDLYTPETRAMLSAHVVTRGQMDNIVRTYRDCPAAQVSRQGGFAVVEHPGDSGRCAPWFLARGPDGLWRLDLLVMQRAVRFDTRNRWRVAAPEHLGDFAFAFDR